jgi:GTPase
VVGNVDAGKSTTVGTLTKGIVDDGRGRARLAVFNHKHEISTGRTSSIGHQILGFDAHGEVVNNRNDRSPTWVEIVNQSTKVVTFWDLAGHERYLRTTINGLTTMAPDYCLVLVGANMGPNHMTREHIYLCLTLKIPFILLVSKIDMVPPNVLEETMTKLHEIVKKGAKRTPFSIKSVDDVLICAKTIKSESIVPILQVSPSSTSSTPLFVSSH